MEPRPKIVIPISPEEIEQLMNGESFDWTFVTDQGQIVDIKVVLEGNN